MVRWLIGPLLFISACDFGDVLPGSSDSNLTPTMVCESIAGTNEYECTDLQTGEIITCKSLPGQEKPYCRSLGTSEQACKSPHRPGDGGSGLQCWDPPSNYCLFGFDSTSGFFCKPDGSKCCRTASSSCFRCGWIAVDLSAGKPRCRSIEGATSLGDELCEVLVAAIPNVAKACLVGGTAEGIVSCKEVEEDPECHLNITEEICG